MKKYLQLKQIPQRTPEWYEQRSRILTSTKIASVLHLNSFHSYDDFLKSPIDATPRDIPKITKSNATKIDPKVWGTVLEPFAVQHIEHVTKHPIGELGLKIHDEYPYLGASPDGIQIINGKPRLIEIKCPKTRQITYQVPLEYWVQCQIAMEVWNIDECLYCEYKFDVQVSKPNVRDLTLIYGELVRGVYWIYQSHWMYTIHRDREWFRKVKCQIVNFYNLKYGPSIGPPSEGEEGKRGGNSMEIETNSSSSNLRKRKRSSSSSSSSSSKRQRGDQGQVIIRNSVNDSVNLNGQKLMSINKLSNFLRDDPILDWLDVHGTNHGYERDRSLFLTFYNQRNLYYKCEVMNECLENIRKHDLTYRVLNAALNNLLDVYQNNILLKLQYDCHLINETRHAMEEKMDVIMMGQLSVNVGKYELWDTFDLLIRREVLHQVFPGKLLRVVMSNYPDSNQEYIPIKIRYTTLDFSVRNFYLKGKHKIDVLKVGAITSCLYYDRNYRFGIIEKHDDYEQLREGLNWLEKVPNLKSLRTLYPNMKNTYDSQWHSTKEQIAREKEELTQISYLGIANRETLHEMGIKKISQLVNNPEAVSELKYSSRIAPFISEELDLPKLNEDEDNENYNDENESNIEVYLDFESVSSLGTDEEVIFLMGILVKDDSGINYHPFLVEDLDVDSQDKMLRKGLNFLTNLGNDDDNIPVFHWSSAEPSMLRRAGFELPDNCEWVDLYGHFVKNHASIPGCYSYGLKSVATRLHELRKIQSSWLYGLDGNTAMVMAWNINHKCRLMNENFCDDPRIQKLCSYNYVDCQVMEEIRRLL